MRSRGILAALSATAVTAVQAAPECVALEGDKDRLACFDRIYGSRQPAGKPVHDRPAATAVNPGSSGPGETPPGWLDSFQVRDDGNVNKVGQNPASLGINRVNGRDATVAKAALIWSGPAFNNWGWQPFASYGVNRNTLAASPSDVRVLSVGTTGAVFDLLDTGFALWPTLSLNGREDRKAKTASSTVLLDTYLIVKPLASGIPFGRIGGDKRSHEWNLFPRFGVLAEDQRRVRAGGTAGDARGAFLGFRADYWPAPFSDRTQVTASSNWYRDGNVDAGLVKRRVQYSKLSVDYHLVDPAAKTWIRPILGIEREVGNDPVGGLSGVNRTLFGLKLLVN